MSHLLFDFKDDQPALQIPGLAYKPDFITLDEHDELISIVNQQPWLSDLKRRVQHYGYKYDYKARGIDGSMFLGPLPDWLAFLSQRLYQEGVFDTQPDQVIINEYQPGQGISAHIDCVPCFGETIASLSLGSQCIMQLSTPQTGEKVDQVLGIGSLITLSGDARFQWTHAIPARKSDVINGVKVPRGRRLSMTFRCVTLDHP